MKIDKLLQSQGFGSRKYCQHLILSGAVCVNGEPCQTIKQQFSPLELSTLTFSVYGEPYEYRERVYLALNKPQGYECSHTPSHHHSVFDLLPDHLRLRGVQAVGRLDQDTTGLLLFTDHGQFLQKMTHPRQHVGKQYQVTTADELDATQLQSLANGVCLHGEKGVFQATDLYLHSTHHLEMTIHQGVYHQVKRMLASVGHKVVGLHRSKIGQLCLTDLRLAEGQWCYLTATQLALLSEK